MSLGQLRLCLTMPFCFLYSQLQLQRACDKIEVQAYVTWAGFDSVFVLSLCETLLPSLSRRRAARNVSVRVSPPKSYSGPSIADCVQRNSVSS